MKTLKKSILFALTLSLCFVLSSGFCNAATVTVQNEQELINAINDASNGDTISLSDNIALTKPIEITGKSLTINGNGHTITRIDTNWTPNGSNGTLITAGGNGTTLTLVDMRLTGSQKYGAQSYNDALLILDNVTISGNGFGGVLVNAGKLEVRNLNLGKNGTPSNNGIEIAKGSGVTEDNNPVLIMNGRLSSTETENVIYLAENDELISFDIRNTEGTTNKIFVQGNKVVVTDSNNAVLYESNENTNITVTGTQYVENPKVDEPTVEPTVPEEKIDSTPKTGVNNYLSLAMISLSIAIIGIVYLKKPSKR